MMPIIVMLLTFHFTFSWIVITNSARLFTRISSVPDRVFNHENSFVVEEKVIGSNDILKIVMLKERNGTIISTPKITKYQHFTFNRILPALRNTFLPDGYPHTVPKEYTTFQTWNLIQDSCSYLRGILSTRAILEGFGVGRNDITAVQAAVQWILRDGASMLGGLLFTSFSSANFGQNVKSWRLFADLINNVGITLDMLAPIFRSHFLLLVCIASVCKSLCGIAAGATGAAIAEHWGGQRGNIADVLAKNGAQHTLLSLLGLSISIPFAKYANASTTRLFSWYAALTALHIYSNIQAMKVLALRSLNLVRYRMLISTIVSEPFMKIFLSTQSTDISDMKKNIQNTIDGSSKYSLEYIAQNEPLFSIIIPKNFRLDRMIQSLLVTIKSIQNVHGHYSNRRNDIDDENNLESINNDNIYLWYSLSQAIHQGVSDSDLRTCLSLYKNEPYVLIISSIPSFSAPLYVRPKIFLCFREGCQNIDIAKGIFESHLLSKVMSTSSLSNSTTASSTNQPSQLSVNKINLIRKLSDELFATFWINLEKKGWDTKRLLLTVRNPVVFKYATNPPI